MTGESRIASDGTAGLKFEWAEARIPLFIEFKVRFTFLDGNPTAGTISL
jgi:hypothetical protein